MTLTLPVAVTGGRVTQLLGAPVLLIPEVGGGGGASLVVFSGSRHEVTGRPHRRWHLGAHRGPTLASSLGRPNLERSLPPCSWHPGAPAKIRPLSGARKAAAAGEQQGARGQCPSEATCHPRATQPRQGSTVRQDRGGGAQERACADEVMLNDSPAGRT